ncbi:OLC1v1017573C4 [Oldenlandia corymbosa var. corymbosa]|uniref:OLC1v1017573C4 n=1 Tax=Oldenlandia corymbosa var. corymbosa TaxID=529605 RepID=A0AAV1E9V0_OLDCO|nr:OLC1v1017573C4 [Oldenlandia corymbosa var. corymbosa]
MSTPASFDSDSDELASLKSQLRRLQSRVEELESENMALVAKLSNCNCQKNNDTVNGHNTAAKSRKRFSGYETIAHRVSRRYVALKVMYFGLRFNGFASEAHMGPTVETEIFNALMKTRLIDRVDKKELLYSRCGRTDKGVSSVGQVIALFLRSKLEQTGGINNHAGEISPEEVCGEIDYVGVINKVLPNDIRVMGWSPAPLDFSARFSCVRREYKYFFWRENLNILEMETAGKKFVGEHDFRNFCKMNATNVHNFRRHIMEFKIFPYGESSWGNELWVLNITGSAFLWHQIRCMAAILFLIGQGLESSDIIDVLLDIEKTPRKPQYLIAPEVPLVLQSCEFEGLRFICSSAAKLALFEHLKKECLNYKLQAAIFSEALQSCSTVETDDTLVVNTKTKKTAVYVPIMSRPSERKFHFVPLSSFFFSLHLFP